MTVDDLIDSSDYLYFLKRFALQVTPASPFIICFHVPIVLVIRSAFAWSS